MMTETEKKPGPNFFQSPWREEWRVDKLKELAALGFTASQIAAQITGVTRNAVVGKLHRMGLSNQRPKPIAVGPPRPKRRAPLNLQSGPVFMPRGPIVEVKMPEGEGEAYSYYPPEKQQVTIVELERHHCRWPVGDPRNADMTDRTKFAFCGGKALQSLPYCAEHSRIAYRAPPRR
jgi:GcrA cell cycle regulator